MIIPVYNAAEFVQEAVESALAQPEVAEVILVEDASPDNSLAVCESLAAAHDRVRLYRHPDGGNHGAAASRNLGILRSTCLYLTFLDADDYLLPGRFAAARQILEANPDVDGVYEATGRHFQSEEVRAQWFQTQGIDPADERALMTTVTRHVPPDELFEALIDGESGYFMGDGLVVKRSALERVGLFDVPVDLHEDTAMWLKLAGVARLVPGRIDEPVAMRRVHAHNRITAPYAVSKRYHRWLVMWDTLWQWGLTNLSRPRQDLILRAYLQTSLRYAQLDSRGLRARWRAVCGLLRLLLRYPSMGSRRIFWQYMLRQLRRPANKQSPHPASLEGRA